ncbi:GntR family transcriptional regulator [Bacillota bacterium Meth-B3]|nr:GntR family transcriptional regulator [Christensenellaceae bacterium]MEA5068907.1 GntR family transcriptional regulator [Christensenellaceae bacterium]
MLRYKEIKRMLMDMVVKMHPGEKLPSRHQLCARLDTSRMTLDKAIAEMEREGILYAQKGSGTYINALIEKTVPVTENWGLILPNVMTTVFVEITRAIENFAESKGINLILCNSDDDIDKQENYIRRLQASPVSGFIMIPVVSEDAGVNYRVYGRLVEAKVPLVFCSRTIPHINAPVVSVNNFYGGYIATRHLIGRGYRNIAFAATAQHNRAVCNDRCQGYISALMEAGLPVRRRLILSTCPDGEESAYRTMRELIASEEEIDAVFGINDAECQMLYRAIEDSGLRVSQDIGVIGFDNTHDCVGMSPPLTSMTYRGMEIGEIAAKILWDMSHKKAPSSGYMYYFCQPELVERQSCLGKEGGR